MLGESETVAIVNFKIWMRCRQLVNNFIGNISIFDFRKVIRQFVSSFNHKMQANRVEAPLQLQWSHRKVSIASIVLSGFVCSIIVNTRTLKGHQIMHGTTIDDSRRKRETEIAESEIVSIGKIANWNNAFRFVMIFITVMNPIF